MMTIDRRGMLRLLGTTALFPTLRRDSRGLPLLDGDRCPPDPLRVNTSGTLSVVIWNQYIELLMPHNGHLTYKVFTTDPNDPTKVVASEDLKAGAIYQITGVDGSNTSPTLSADSHVVLKSQQINRGGGLHCSIILPLPNRVDAFCEIQKKNGIPFFTKAPNGVDPKSLISQHAFVYTCFDNAHLSTISPVGNVLNISAEPKPQNNPKDTGPFKSNTKLLKGLSMELNKIYLGEDCLLNSPKVSHPQHQLPACMKLIVDNRV